jgi:signal transduction histidine kinase
LWVLLELIFAYLLIGYTGGITSNFYLVLLLPVISAATYLGVVGTLFFTLLSCGSYISFVLFVDFTHLIIEPDQIRVLIMRLIYLAIAGNLVNVLAAALRVQSANYRRAAEELAEANRHLSEAEAAVRRSERLAALGQLSAGLAHELRNPLGTMKASAEMLMRNVGKENETAREVAGFISTEVDRTNSLVTRFLEFARPMRLRLETVNVAEILDHSVALLERDAPQYRVTVYKNYSPDLAPFPLDGELMERVFYNLLLNAAQASAGGGAITVKTRPCDGMAEVAVIDRGQGIQPKDLEQIFNPFFTTKPEGSGLGLAIVSKIVDEHGGRIAVESETGKGSVFRVYLPLQPKT